MAGRAIVETISYEVQRQAASGWEIVGVHDRQEAALQEAAEVYQSVKRARAVRVIRETYNPQTNRTQTTTIARHTPSEVEVTPESFRRPASGKASSGRSAAPSGGETGSRWWLVGGAGLLLILGALGAWALLAS